MEARQLQKSIILIMHLLNITPLTINVFLLKMGAFDCLFAGRRQGQVCAESSMGFDGARVSS